MVPQDQLFLLAPIRNGEAERLRALLESMNAAPGHADPLSALVPFARLESVHVARFVILDDPSLEDRKAFPVLPVSEPLQLAFIADCDGSADDLIAAMAREAGPGLAAIYAHCQGYDDDADLAAWLRAHRVRSAALYVNWIGRGVRQVREEAELHRALRVARIAHDGLDPEAMRPLLEAAGQAVPLTPLPPPALGWRLRKIGHFVLLPIFGLLLLPYLILLSPLLIFTLRRHEKRDPVIAPVPSRARNRMLAGIEDRDVSNQYSAIGSLKPGPFRRWLTVVILWVINWGARHIFNKGRLARVNTIQFASWTFLDGKRRVFFASNYDGSREAYNDDFINKVAFGLNLSFSNGLGYPRTDWLIHGGARREQDFKYYLFHHQIPTQVWYKACPGLTTYDMARNARIRQGFEHPPMGEALRRWIAEI